jgi:hypothetical protein
MEQRLFNKIYNSIPKNIFVNDDGILSCAIDIYLTWCGIRPACIPFDGEIKYGGISGNEMTNRMLTTIEGKQCLAKLAKIPKLKVIIGPYYYYATTSIVIYNSTLNIEPVLAKIKSLHDEIDILKQNKSNKTLIDNTIDQIHVQMGFLLGFECPIDIPTLFNQHTKCYDITYKINTREHLSCSCPFNTKNIINATKRLEIINDALQKLKQKKINNATLEINIETLT